MSVQDNIATLNATLTADAITNSTTQTGIDNYLSQHAGALAHIVNDPAASELFNVAQSVNSVDDTNTPLHAIWLADGANLTLAGPNNLVIGMDDTGSNVDLTGSTGNNHVFGGTADNIVALGQGADQFFGQTTGTDHITGGPGSNQVIDESAASGRAFVTLGTGDHEIAIGSAGSSSQFSGGLGGTGDVVISQGTSDNIDKGFAGFTGANDLLALTGDGSRAFGGSGANQTLAASGANDSLFTGTGGDHVFATGQNDIVNVGATGNDTVFGNGTTTLNISSHALADLVSAQVGAGGVETLTFTSGQTVKVAGGITSANLSDGSVALTDADAPNHAQAHADAVATHIASIVAAHAHV